MTMESGIWRLRRLIPGGEIGNLADQKDAVAAAERVAAELDWKLGAVLAFSDNFASLSRAARRRGRIETVEQYSMPDSESLGDQDLGLLPDEFTTRVPEKPLGFLAHQADGTSAVEQDHPRRD